MQQPLKLKDHWVVKINCQPLLFTAVFAHYKTDEVKSFIISDEKNDLMALKSFIKASFALKQWWISFDGIRYEAQVLHWIFDRWYKNQLDVAGASQSIYGYASSICNKEFLDYQDWKMQTTQIDLYKMNGWGQKNSPIQWIEYSLDLPISGSADKSPKTISELIAYTKSVKQIMNCCKEQISLRLSLSKRYQINLMSASEPRIAKEIFAKLLAQRCFTTPEEIKKLRTVRNGVPLKKVILPKIYFLTGQFRRLHDFFSEQTVFETKKALEYSIINFHGVDIKYGLGGIHASRNPGIYMSTNKRLFISCDIRSCYTSLMIQNEWVPKHLSKAIFMEVINWFKNQRDSTPRENPEYQVFKDLMSSIYGLSLRDDNLLSDKAVGLAMAVNGQLLISQLIETILEKIPGSLLILANTDGFDMMIPRQYEDRYFNRCKDWEKQTKLVLAYEEYDRMFLKNVNNYLAISKEGKIKATGCFKWDDSDKKAAGSLSKNKSFLVVRKAVSAYFLKNIEPEDYLKTNRNIFDYCAGIQASDGWQFESDGVSSYPNVVRYFISIDGRENLSKWRHDGGQKIRIDSGYKITLYNEITEIDFASVNMDYYLEKIREEIAIVNNIPICSFTQMDLFGMPIAA